MKKSVDLLYFWEGISRMRRNPLAARKLTRLLVREPSWRGRPEVRCMTTGGPVTSTSISDLLCREAHGVKEIQPSLNSLELGLPPPFSHVTLATQEDANVGEDDADETKKHLNVVFIGHVDAGKSTTAGQILFLSGQVDDATVLKYEKEAKGKSRESWYKAYIMDTNEEERVKTVEVGMAYFETEHTRFTILDAPDPKSYVPNMISGASQADIGVLVISARKGEFETGQIREHVLLAKTLGVAKLVVLINEMDEPTVKWSKERYDEIEAETVPFLKSSGYNVKKDVQFLPISGLVGSNMKTRMDKSICSWWDGPCLFEVLDSMDVPLCGPKGPVRTIIDKHDDMGANDAMATFALPSAEVGLGSLYYNKLFSRKYSHVPHQGTESSTEAKLPIQDEGEPQKSLVLGDKNLLKQRIDDALHENKQKLDKSSLKHWYEREFRPRLSCKCLLLPEDLSGSTTAFLHHQHHKSTREDPQYLSAYELMVQRTRIDDAEEWDYFWNQIIKDRVFIVDTWHTNVSNVETLNYDYGLTGFYKGEADASYYDGKRGKKGKARVSFLIWKDYNLLCAEVYNDMDCDSIHHAEAYAVLALCFKCFEMNIEDLVLWTDNKDIHGCITGAYTVKNVEKPTMLEEERSNLFLLLGCLRKKFTQLRALHKPRQMMFLANSLVATGGFPNLEDALRKFNYELSQKAVFKLTLAGTASADVKKFGYNMFVRQNITKFFVLVDDLDKVDAVADIRDTLRPSGLYLVIHRLDEKPDDFQIRLKQMTGSNLYPGIVKDGYTVIHQVTKDKGKELVIVMDGSIPQDGYDYLGCFTVILVSSMERKQLDPAILELNALSYRYFSGVVA